MAAPNLDRAAWLAERNPCITATRIAAIVGLHPWETQRTVFEQITGRATEKPVTESMEMGTELEPFIAAMFAKRRGLAIGTGLVANGFTIWKHPANARHAATPDYLLGDDELVECKWAGVNAAFAFGKEQTDEAPAHYLIQCQWQLYVTGRKVCWLAVLTPYGLRVFRVEADPETHRRLAFHADKFLGEYIDADFPPPLSGNDPDTEWVKKKFPQDNGSVVAATSEVEEWVADLGHKKTEAKKLDGEIACLENRIKEFMGEASVMTTDEGAFTYKKIDQERIDSKKLRAEFPEAAAACTTQTSYRRFMTPWRSERA